MKSLERALKASRLVLEGNAAGDHYEATLNPFGSEEPRRTLNHVLSILKANFRSGDLLDLVGELKVVANEIVACQRNNERAFKFVWYHHVADQQRTRHPSIDVIGNVEDSVWQALNSVLSFFRVHPFAVSPDTTRRIYDLPTFAILNCNHAAATRHEGLARQIGKAWVDGRFPGYDFRTRELDVLQSSLFELLWTGTVEQLQRHSPHSSDDPERPEFEKAVKELGRVLQEGILRSKKQHFSIAFCGMVNAGKSLFLNYLMGQSILPSDGESDDSCMPHPMLSIIAELSSTAWPCRFRHVEGQTVPELQFQAEPFLVALKKLQAHQYGRRMQTYQPPSEDMFESLFSDVPSDPSDEEILLRTIHSQWINLHAITRDNLLKFETPEFTLPPMAIGEQNVKILVSSVSHWIVLFQLNAVFS
jgi:hypothetical protein